MPNAIFVSRKDIENELYDFCKLAISSYMEEGRNEDVYTFSIYTDSYHGSYIIYLNNYASLNETVDIYDASNKQKYAEKGDEYYKIEREKLLHELKYAEGDYPYMFEIMPDQLESYLNMISSIVMEEPEYLSIEHNYIFEKTIEDSELFLIAIDVIHRLQDDFKQLKKSDDFIAYVSAADGVGGDYLTLSQLMRKCVGEEQLYKAMPDLKQKDLEFNGAIEVVRQLPLSEQVEHWVQVIEGGEFGKGSMRSFWRTDYDAYEQLMGLGIEVLPIIHELLEGELKKDTKGILEMVVEDLRAE